MLLTFSPWGDRVSAFNARGEPLWAHETSDGVDDLWPADLDGDGSSEVVIGLNGGGGVWALGADGRVLWSDRSIGNVWHVTAGPMDGGTLRVATTSAAGLVHVFAASGEKVRDLQARFYATDIRFGDQPYVGGSEEGGGSALATLDPSGWLTKFSGAIGAGATRPSLPWVAVSTMGGSVYAFRAANGSLDGVVTQQGMSPEVAWTGEGKSLLLVVASNSGLKAYRVPSGG